MIERKLKPGWRVCRFDQMAFEVKDRIERPVDSGLERYVGLEHLDSGSLKIWRWGSTSDVEKQKLLFKSGDIIFGRRNAYLRRVAVADFDGVCSAHAMVLRAHEDVVLPDFLPLYMQTDTFWETALKVSAGSMSPTINWRNIAKEEFALPPLEEQRRIAVILTSAIVLTESYFHLIEKNKKLWRALAFEHIVEAYTHGTVRLGKLINYGSDGPFGSKLKTKHYVESGVRVIRLQNIDALFFNDTDKAYIPKNYFQNELLNYTVNAGDVLIAGMGDDNIQAGRSCIAPEYIEPAINKADCYCLRPGPKLDARYLVVFLNSPQGLQQSMAYSQGTTRYRLNLGNIKRMKIPLPDINFQRELATQLDRVFEAEQTSLCRYDKQRETMKILLNSLLGGL